MLKVKQMSKWCIGSWPEKAGPSKKLRHTQVCKTLPLSAPLPVQLQDRCYHAAGTEMKGAHKPSCTGRRELADFWAAVPILILVLSCAVPDLA